MSKTDFYVGGLRAQLHNPHLGGKFWKELMQADQNEL